MESLGWPLGSGLRCGARRRHPLLPRSPRVLDSGRIRQCRTPCNWRGPGEPSMTSTHAANVRSDGTHPRHRLEQQLLHAVRFSIVATLAATDLAEFRFVRDTVEISDSFLSKQ